MDQDSGTDGHDQTTQHQEQHESSEDEDMGEDEGTTKTHAQLANEARLLADQQPIQLRDLAEQGATTQDMIAALDQPNLASDAKVELHHIIKNGGQRKHELLTWANTNRTREQAHTVLAQLTNATVEDVAKGLGVSIALATALLNSTPDELASQISIEEQALSQTSSYAPSPNARTTTAVEHPMNTRSKGKKRHKPDASSSKKAATTTKTTAKDPTPAQLYKEWLDNKIVWKKAAGTTLASLKEPAALTKCIKARPEFFWTLLNDFSTPRFAIDHLTQPMWEAWQRAHIRAMRTATVAKIYSDQLTQDPDIIKWAQQTAQGTTKELREKTVRQPAAWNTLAQHKYLGDPLLRLLRPDRHDRALYIAGLTLLHPELFDVDDTDPDKLATPETLTAASAYYYGEGSQDLRQAIKDYISNGIWAALDALMETEEEDDDHEPSSSEHELDDSDDGVYLSSEGEAQY